MPPAHEIPWTPITPDEAARLFQDWDGFWCIAGGWALDLFAREQSRPHDDIDVLILRGDVDRLHAHLRGWELHAADPPGELRRWRSDEPLPERVHDIWCRPDGTRNWQFQLMVMDHDNDRWILDRKSVE